jgi:hypothetical protein
VRDADACGGCFHPETTVVRTGTETTSSVITDHRMVFKVSAEETILWDQVRYTGAPEEFAWVLPVHEGAKIELSRNEFIASLDAVTQTTVQGPSRSCRAAGGGPVTNYAPSSGGGGGCGSSVDEAAVASGGGSPTDDKSAGADVDGGAETPNIQVVAQSVIGPYQALTLHSKNGQGISDWLTQNKFAIPDNVKPTIDAYTSEGFDFIALRLRPGTGVQAMRPVRVVTQGMDASLPLRMVAAGIGAHVGLTLWVIGEGRYAAQNFPNGMIDDSQLTWDAKQGRSNLTQLETDELAKDNGTHWITQAAGPQTLTVDNSATSVINNVFTKTLYSTYQSTCITNPPRQKPCSEDQLPTGDAGAGDAGTPDTCTEYVSGCDGYDDLDVASRGLHDGDVWVTRMRADLPAASLQTDFQLQASEQTPISAIHKANVFLDPNDDPCPNGIYRSSSSSSSSGNNAAPPPDDGSCTCRIPKKTNNGTWLLIGATAFAAARLTRRRRPRP